MDWQTTYDRTRAEARTLSDDELTARWRDAGARAHETGSEADKGVSAALYDERQDRNRAVRKAKGLSA